jgi:pimeloyl-ACP methyl ester carboxylesterase
VRKGRVQAGGADIHRVVRAPVLLLAGGADPLDPAANLRGWRRVFPRGRLIVVPGAGHGTIEYACVQKLIARFVARASAAALDPACARHVSLPPFVTG